MQIKPLSDISLDNIYKAFSRAFAEYEMQLDRDGLQAMLRRRGFDPEISFAAFDGDDIIAFTLNGFGSFDGKRTAYDTGTGTVKEYRGQGLATKIFEHSLPYLRERGIKQYLLEVLQHNTAAVGVYSRLGFEVTREFYYFRREAEKVKRSTKRSGIPCRIELIEPAVLASLPLFGDFMPSWQNGTESILRSPDDFMVLGAYSDNVLIGSCVFEPSSGDLTQLAVDINYRRRGIGSLLFDTALTYNRSDVIKVINTEITCTALTAFLGSKNIFPSGKQFEMVKPL